MENNSNLIKCTNLNENKDSNKTPEIAESKSEKNNLEQKNKNNKENEKNKSQNIKTKINYFNYIKEYLSKNSNDQEYINTIK